MKTYALKHELNEQVAIALFGWRWLAEHGIPVKGTPDYPTKQQVRRLYPPESELFKGNVGRQWRNDFERNPRSPATGDEPLSYCYCSSNGPHWVPDYSGSDVRLVEKEIRRRKLVDAYIEALISLCGTVGAMTASPEDKCHAALAAVLCTSSPPTRS